MHVEQRHVDVLALAGALAVRKGRQDGGDGVDPVNTSVKATPT